MRKAIESFEIVDHGIQHEQYFQGCGVSFTEFTDCATGIGNDHCEALEDCLEQLACMGWDVESIKPDSDFEFTGNMVKNSDSDDCHYYVSVRVKAVESMPIQG
jgi:hypothetical protein